MSVFRNFVYNEEKQNDIFRCICKKNSSCKINNKLLTFITINILLRSTANGCEIVVLKPILNYYHYTHFLSEVV